MVFAQVLFSKMHIQFEVMVRFKFGGKMYCCMENINDRKHCRKRIIKTCISRLKGRSNSNQDQKQIKLYIVFEVMNIKLDKFFKI